MTYRLMQEVCLQLSDLLLDSVRLAEARHELSDISTAIGTTAYMDPPDGGGLTLAEQIARMAKDAARYRWLRDVRSVTIDTMLHGNGCRTRSADELDAAIDDAMARKS